MSNAHVVIVGAGHAGGSTAAFLRQYGHEGPITLLGEEPHPPYQRPPLSKAWLKGEADAPSLLLRPAEWYAENAVALRCSAQVADLDADARRLTLADGASLRYDILVLATGARARPLPVPGADLPGVLFLRDAADADRLKAAIGPGRRVVIAGGGYVGLEVAASARHLGAEVTVVERESRLVSRVACPILSEMFLRVHRRHGVQFRLATEVTAIRAGPDGVEGVALSDGTTAPADLVLVGVGAIPNDHLARRAGLSVRDGVIVDAHARTTRPEIYAVGDLTRRPVGLYEGDFRLESVPNALEQARQAAAHIVGRAPPPAETPWFWSDQYDLKLQIAGLPVDADATVVRGDPDGSSFAVFHLRGDRIRAVEAVNAPPEFMAGKQLIASGAPVDPVRLADASISMKAVGRPASPATQ